MIKLAPDHATKFDVALSVVLLILISLLISTQCAFLRSLHIQELKFGRNIVNGSYTVWCVARSMNLSRCSDGIEAVATTEVNSSLGH